MNIYDALGGDAGVRQLVNDLATRMADDAVLGPLFDGVDHEALQRHRVSYLTAVLGGPEHYLGKSMRDAHRPLHLTDEHMTRFLRLTTASLEAAGVTPAVANAVLDQLERLRPAVVDPAPGARS